MALLPDGDPSKRIANDIFLAGDAVRQSDQIIRCASCEVNDRSWILSIRNHLFKDGRWLVICVLLLACICTACTRESKAERLHSAAKEHVKDGELKEAVKLYDRLLEEYGDTEAARSASKEAVLYRGLSDAVKSYSARSARDLVLETARAIQKYRRGKQSWPRTLEDLVPKYLRKVPIDPWGRQLFYAAKESGRGYWLACYGEQGLSGGIGDNADWLVEDGSFVRKLSRELR
jgi:hypothetical protein